MRRLILLLVATALLLPAFGTAQELAAPSQSPRQIDEFTIAGPRSYLDGYHALLSENAINVVFEIPAGTNAKWEVRKSDGALAWEFRDGKPRIVQYLPYPANYGMIPQTLLAKDEGGDGDPLDVIVLGPAAERGTILSAWPVGVLRLLDGGEIDDKILAVAAGAPLEWGKALGLDEIRANYPGVLEIVEIWFSSYKGPGELESRGFSDAKAAWDMIYEASETYHEASQR